jgi:hypothetical protein
MRPLILFCALSVTLIPEEGNEELDAVDEDAPPVKKRITDWSQAIVKRDRFKAALQGSGRFAELVEKVCQLADLWISTAKLTDQSKSLPHRENIAESKGKGSEEAEELSAVALLNWEDQILWGVK